VVSKFQIFLARNSIVTQWEAYSRFRRSFPDGGAVVINRFGDYEDQSYIVWARAVGNGAFRLLARPFQHQGDPLSTKTFKVSGFTKAMKALPTAILNTC